MKPTVLMLFLLLLALPVPQSFAQVVVNPPHRYKETGYDPGAVIAVLEYMRNYPDGAEPFPDPEGGFDRATLLKDGTLIVRSKAGTKTMRIASRSLMEVSNQASTLFETPTVERTFKHGYIKPNTRGELSVAHYDWRSKSWSKEVRIVWLENNCDYDFHLEPESLYDHLAVASMIARIESLAFEMVKTPGRRSANSP